MLIPWKLEKHALLIIIEIISRIPPTFHNTKVIFCDPFMYKCNLYGNQLKSAYFPAQCRVNL